MNAYSQLIKRLLQHIQKRCGKTTDYFDLREILL